MTGRFWDCEMWGLFRGCGSRNCDSEGCIFFLRFLPAPSSLHFQTAMISISTMPWYLPQERSGKFGASSLQKLQFLKPWDKSFLHWNSYFQVFVIRLVAYKMMRGQCVVREGSLQDRSRDRCQVLKGIRKWGVDFCLTDVKCHSANSGDKRQGLVLRGTQKAQLLQRASLDPLVHAGT